MAHWLRTVLGAMVKLCTLSQNGVASWERQRIWSQRFRVKSLSIGGIMVGIAAFQAGISCHLLVTSLGDSFKSPVPVSSSVKWRRYPSSSYHLRLPWGCNVKSTGKGIRSPVHVWMIVISSIFNIVCFIFKAQRHPKI